jgi:hypothetical protein
MYVLSRSVGTYVLPCYVSEEGSIHLAWIPIKLSSGVGESLVGGGFSTLRGHQKLQLITAGKQLLSYQHLSGLGDCMIHQWPPSLQLRTLIFIVFLTLSAHIAKLEFLLWGRIWLHQLGDFASQRLTAAIQVAHLEPHLELDSPTSRSIEH